MLDLSGKVAFVSGAGSVGEGQGDRSFGNGKATAVLMARQGAHVFGTDINPAALAETAAIMAREGLSFAGRVTNMTDSADVAAAVQDCVARFGGRIDILVNNVGGSAPGGPVDMTEEAWDAQMQLNLKTCFLGCKHVLPVMLAQQKGAVVNLASVGCMSFTVGGRVNAAYAASKAGVIAFSRATAIAHVKDGIRVNTVVPGTMHTPLVEHRLVKQMGLNDAEALIARRNASVPMGFMGNAWDIANAVVFLASDEARYITATQLVVDGGLTAARPTG